MLPWFDENDLGILLDGISPFDLPGCTPTGTDDERDGSTELNLFAHPDWHDVLCKFGYMERKQRVGRLWFLLKPDHMLLLTVGMATPRELALLRQINGYEEAAPTP